MNLLFFFSYPHIHHRRRINSMNAKMAPIVQLTSKLRNDINGNIEHDYMILL